jgi:hypothetical protein
MKRDPWTDPDPQPEDFDEFFANLTPDQVESHEGDPDHPGILSLTEEEADRIRGIGLRPDENPQEVAAEILRRARERRAAEDRASA